MSIMYTMKINSGLLFRLEASRVEEEEGGHKGLIHNIYVPHVGDTRTSDACYAEKEEQDTQDD